MSLVCINLRFVTSLQLAAGVRFINGLRLITSLVRTSLVYVGVVCVGLI